MRVLTVVAVVAVVALASLPRPAAATPSDDLAKARDVFHRGDYKDAIPLLSSLLYPKNQLASRSEVSEAHLLLGVSYFEIGDPGAADREFGRALFVDPKLAVDGLFPEKVVKFFNHKKEELRRKAKESEKLRQIAEERDAYRRALENSFVIEKRKYYVNFIPFGAGQFQNGERAKGVSFFVAETLLGGASLTMYAVQVIKYGYAGHVPRSEIDGVNKLQIAQIATGGLCLAVMAWGIIDSLAHYKPTVQRATDKSLLPPGFKLQGGRHAKTSSLRLIPSLGPQGAGLTLSMEF